ncbi:unnamed protein product [Allacma fusca]|uniref:UDP-N-acetylglucosamine transferase subunit ALG13 n=1 Tax=Allacma fusca TaxID=39272 RepID=A0A8J2PLI1_9HEXA|nr:unnamed protein product [Allacma fusca]
MATKKCPNCGSDCPVASSSCKKCLHVFKSRKGSSNSITSTAHSVQSASMSGVIIEDTGGTSEGLGRRHTGRITRSKPNFYDSLHVEEQMRQETELVPCSAKQLPAVSSCDKIRKLFVTVGTTKFEELVTKIQTEEFLQVCIDIGIQEICVQAGESGVGEGIRTFKKLILEFFHYKTDIKSDIDSADLVISHAGAGTVIDVLSLKKKLIVVPNSTLMNNHQDELAIFLAEKQYAFKSTINDLSDTLKKIVSEKIQIVPLPDLNPDAFDHFLKHSLGMDAAKILVAEHKSELVSSSESAVPVVAVANIIVFSILVLLITQKLLLRKQLKQSKSEEDGSGASGGGEDNIIQRDKDTAKTGEPLPKKRKRGRPPGITGKKPTNAGRIAIHNKTVNSVKISNHNPAAAGDEKDLIDKDEDIMADITPEKALQYNIVLNEINRKWVSANWKVS